MQSRAFKLKPCVICGNEFKPFKTTDRVCGWRCAKELQRQAEEKAKLRKTARKPNDYSVRVKAVERWFNKFIKLRDKHEPCISCGNYADEYHAGHYRSVGSAPEIRFLELNVHKQCKECNIDKHGNYTKYQQRLKLKIGPQNLAFVEGPHEMCHYTIAELREMEQYYKSKCEELEKCQI